MIVPKWEKMIWDPIQERTKYIYWSWVIIHFYPKYNHAYPGNFAWIGQVCENFSGDTSFSAPNPRCLPLQARLNAWQGPLHLNQQLQHAKRLKHCQLLTVYSMVDFSPCHLLKPYWPMGGMDRRQSWTSSIDLFSSAPCQLLPRIRQPWQWR